MMMMNAHTQETQAAISPANALELLKEGNGRFVSKQTATRDLNEQVQQTSSGQYPFRQY